MTQIQLGYWNLQEQKRSNRANEEETNRANVARETETARHNLATEQETNRHNVETEKETHRSNFAREQETQRHNIATERTEQGKLAESIRHNVSTETISRDANKIAQDKNDIAREQNAETNRHNNVMEIIQRDLADANISEAISRNDLRKLEAKLVKAKTWAERSNIVTNWIKTLTGGYKDVMGTVGSIIDALLPL